MFIVAAVSQIQIIGCVNNLHESGKICLFVPVTMHPNSVLAHNKNSTLLLDMAAAAASLFS